MKSWCSTMKKEKVAAPAYSGKKHNLITVLLCCAGTLLNLLLGKLSEVFGLPLYLDTVGSISVSAMGGYLPGVIVGFSTNVLKSFEDSSAMYYGILNVLIAICSSIMVKRGFFKKPLKIVATIILFAVIGGLGGALIPWFLDEIEFDSATLRSELYRTGAFSREAAHFLSSFLYDLIDKAVSVILSVLIINLIPQKQHSLFSFTGWMQTPLSNEESSAAKKTSFRVVSLKTKILVALSVSLILVSVAATAISVALYRNALIKDHTKLAQGVANITAKAIDPELVDDFLEKGAEMEEYKDTLNLLAEIRESSQDIEYVYVYKILPDGCHVVFDVDTEEVEGSPAGSVIPFDE